MGAVVGAVVKNARFFWKGAITEGGLRACKLSSRKNINLHFLPFAKANRYLLGTTKKWKS